jgi:nicotinamide-nucleotide amidase
VAGWWDAASLDEPTKVTDDWRSPPRSGVIGFVRVEVVNTGTELMLGHILNRHLVSLAETLFPLGLRIQRQVTVPDGSAIRDAMLETFGRADVVLVTGGLGPTTDDLTREITAELLGLHLEHDEEIMEHIRERFARRGLHMTERVKLQALRPREATVLHNPHGTAPGLYFPPLALARHSGESPHIFLLPGPPRELLPMVEEKVLPILRKLVPAAAVQEMRTFRVVGMGESLVEDKVGADLLGMGLEVGYCARPGEVDLRLIGSRAALDRAAGLVQERLGGSIFTRDQRALEQVLVQTLTEKGCTMALAESCTGGFLANKVTNVAGASKVFLAGYVTYANEVKTAALGVPADLIAQHGAVSAPVAKAMAEGAMRASKATFGLSTTGIAGPDGGTPEKPVGTVYIALAQRGVATLVQRHRFPTDRETFKHLVAQSGLDLLLRRLDGREVAPEGEFSPGDGGCGGVA